ncbi:DUF5107 domain-containing protein [Mumia qirimensis]|uniref:DUF5107 domain-containing protein n=1 Tax=Mumia qirimensis TaxID=3234852 RepID=UPI00351D81BE
MAESAAAAAAAKPLDVAAAYAVDSKSFEIRFSAPLGDEIRTFVDGNPAYLAEYLRVSGGRAGQSDASLDGRSLDEVTGTRVYTVDGDPRSLRVILGAEVSLRATSYKVWLDGDGHTLSDDLLIRAANGAEFRGETTKAQSFRGATHAPGKASFGQVKSRDSRTLRVTFAESVIAGMPAGRYSATGITVKRADGSDIRPSYVQAVTGSDRRVWDLTFTEDLGKGDRTLSLAGGTHALVTAGGSLGASDVLTGSVSGNASQRTAPKITDVQVDKQRANVVIRFDRKIDTFNGGEDAGPLAETPKGTGGSTLDRDSLLDGVELAGKVDGKGSLEDNLEEVAAYAPDLHTLVVKLEAGDRLVAGSRGSVSLDKGIVTDLAGTDNGKQTVRFTVPRSKTPKEFDASARDYLKVDKTSTANLRRNAFTYTDPENDDFSVRPENVENRLIDEKHDAIVVENKYIEATFVPGYGGRLLSLIYKPTGNDLLYTNPTGTPYGFTSTPPGQKGNSPFYHNWLMVWGGIFPTLTQAEHGKYWFMPWDYEIEQTGDSVAITMTKKDDFDYADKPGNYTYGKTELETSVTYTVSKTSPGVDMSVSIHNPTDTTKKYEYWTCTTLAPGAPSDAGSPTMEIVSPVSVIQRESWYPWMDDVEKPANPATPGDRYKVLDKLKKMVNWNRDGIAYGQGLKDNPQGDWWGVINQENGEGVVRVGDNDVTPGMKFWEWGFANSFDTNIFKNGSSARPYIELWAGVSNKFFEAKTIGAGETISWTESYLPTMDLANVTNANEAGSAEVAFSGTGANRTVRGDVFSTRIGERLGVRLVDTATGKVLASKQFTGAAEESTDLSARVGAGATVRLELTDRTGKVILTADKTAD